MSELRGRARVHWKYRDKTGVYEDNTPSVWFDDDGTPNFFMWEEGNFSCDCNKSNFFGLAEDGGFWSCGDEIEITKLEVISEHK